MLFSNGSSKSIHFNDSLLPAVIRNRGGSPSVPVSTSFPGPPHHEKAQTSLYTRLMNSLVSKESLADKFHSGSSSSSSSHRLIMSSSSFPLSEAEPEPNKLFSDSDYSIFIPHDDSDDYLVSPTTTTESSPSSLDPSTFWNESFVSIGGEFDNSPSLNFSSLSDFFAPSSVVNVSDLELANSMNEQPDLTIHHPILAFILAIMCLTVIAGNVLVMVAIRRERNLQTVTNYFVTSLSASDCLVGLIVMPFSVVHEVMNKSWIFGQDWCDLWHSFDVLASTASILNLCVISMDRYWAITDPLAYPSKMTSKRAKMWIAGVWLSSSLISFPAIVWWRAVSTGSSREYQCTFTDDVGYLVFSSIISFYGPLSVMIFVYYRIYRAAVEQTRCIDRGSKHVPMHTVQQSSSGHSAQVNDNENGPVVLRIHRGGFTSMNQALQQAKRQQQQQQPGSSSSSRRSASKTTRRKGTTAKLSTIDDAVDDEDGAAGASSPGSSSPGRTEAAARAQRNLKAWSMGKRFAKLAKEKKAAKTLGIVMGVFILCWLPFFVTNILIGICPDSCISDPELVFSIVTWLGWLNSGMNPVIYACWSRDFRRAFKKILCSLLLCCRPSSSSGDSFYGGSAAYYGTPAAAAAAMAAAAASSTNAACRTHSSSSSGEPGQPSQHRNEQNSILKARREQEQHRVTSRTDAAASEIKSENLMPGERKSSSASTSSSGAGKKNKTKENKVLASANRKNNIPGIEFDPSSTHNGCCNQINLKTVSEGVCSQIAATNRSLGEGAGHDNDDDEQVVFVRQNSSKGLGGKSEAGMTGMRKKETGGGLQASQHKRCPIKNANDGQHFDDEMEAVDQQQQTIHSSISGCPVNPLQANDLYSDPGDRRLSFLHPHQVGHKKEGKGSRKEAASARTLSTCRPEEGNEIELNHRNNIRLTANESYHETALLSDMSSCSTSRLSSPGDSATNTRRIHSHPNSDPCAGSNMSPSDGSVNEDSDESSCVQERKPASASHEQNDVCRSDNDSCSINDSTSSSSSEGIIETVTISLQNSIVIRTS